MCQKKKSVVSVLFTSQVSTLHKSIKYGKNSWKNPAIKFKVNTSDMQNCTYSYKNKMENRKQKNIMWYEIAVIYKGRVNPRFVISSLKSNPYSYYITQHTHWVQLRHLPLVFAYTMTKCQRRVWFGSPPALYFSL